MRAESKTFIQAQPAAVWLLAHGFDRRPSVTILDVDNTQVEGTVTYPDSNHVVITFSIPVAGLAYLV